MLRGYAIADGCAYHAYVLMIALLFSLIYARHDVFAADFFRCRFDFVF